MALTNFNWNPLQTSLTTSRPITSSTMIGKVIPATRKLETRFLVVSPDHHKISSKKKK